MVETIDPRKILRGYDGALYHDGQLLAEVNDWRASITVANSSYQPARSRITVGVTTGYSVGLTFTETVIRDVLLLAKLLEHLRGDSDDISFDFMGELLGHDGTAHRSVYRACEPDGTIDIAGATQGDIITRPWSFSVNEPPDLQNLLGAA
jgi:hypothetical protein